jgi:hypothetical protein
VINVCNQGKTLCSPCSFAPIRVALAKNHYPVGSKGQNTIVWEERANAAGDSCKLLISAAVVIWVSPLAMDVARRGYKNGEARVLWHVWNVRHLIWQRARELFACCAYSVGRSCYRIYTNEGCTKDRKGNVRDWGSDSGDVWITVFCMWGVQERFPWSSDSTFRATR